MAFLSGLSTYEAVNGDRLLNPLCLEQEMDRTLDSAAKSAYQHGKLKRRSEPKFKDDALISCEGGNPLHEAVTRWQTSPNCSTGGF